MLYRDGEICIRELRREDVAPLVAAENAQGWHSTPEKLCMRLRDQAQGRCAALAAEADGAAVGYVNVYWNSRWGPEPLRGLPEIVDFAVLEKYRGRGIGTRLMDAAEQLAAERADTVYLGVGLHSGYGSAQRMYVKRGYVPDGTGVWYGEQVCPPYGPAVNDDDLVLYLSKKLK